MKTQKQTTARPVKNPIAQKKDVYLYWIVAAAMISFGLSVFNDYALDDFIVIVKNKYTLQGFAGIWNILSHDSFAGMTAGDVVGLAGVRYRPLSLVTFAIEQQFFKGSPFISHLINVILYAISGVLLFKWLLQFKTTYSDDRWKQIALVASLLFMVLPVHSESIINIKGRDDIFCLLFFLLTSLQLFKYVNSGMRKNLAFAAVFYFLSIMSKETAITFLAVFPLTLFLFSNSTRQKLVSVLSVTGSVACLFLLFRYLATTNNAGIMSTDILNNPFINASSIQRFATVLYCWLLYLELILFPLHLSYDYNFNQVPLTHFDNPWVVLSIAIHLSMAILAIYFFRKKRIYAFSILFYFITFSVVSNLFLDTGAPIAERFMLFPSIGFCLAISTMTIAGFEKLKERKVNLPISQFKVLLLVTVLSAFTIRNVMRCYDWKDNNILFLADVNQTPNSAKSQLNAGIACLNYAGETSGTEKEKWIDKSQGYLAKGIEIYPKKIDGYINLGVGYSWKNDFENAELWWNKAIAINPTSLDLVTPLKVLANHYFQQGMQFGSDKKFDASIGAMVHALQYDSLNAEIFFNIGGAYYTIQHWDSAIYYFQKTISLNPDYPNALTGLHSAMSSLAMKQGKK
ncbi:MAG: DUF1736 domain-containing protein [Bacteroidota bacterium]